MNPKALLLGPRQVQAMVDVRHPQNLTGFEFDRT